MMVSMLDCHEKNLWKSQNKIVLLNLIDLIGSFLVQTQNKQSFAMYFFFQNPVNSINYDIAFPKATFIRRISAASNAIQTIDNEANHFIIPNYLLSQLHSTRQKCDV